MKITLKNKTIKNTSILVIIVLALMIVVPAYYYFKREGFSDISDDSGTCEEKAAAVPGCFATVQPDRNDEFLQYDKDDYVLKTQIETPVCPNTPYEYNDNNFGSFTENDYDDHETATVDDSTIISSSMPSTLGSDIKPDRDPSSQLSNLNNVGVNPNDINSTSSPSSLDTSYMINIDAANSSGQNNTTTVGDIQLKYPTISNPAPATSQDTGVNKPGVDGKCPPCPACQRCPEPVVECKKVINYGNAANNGQLPVPYINDFSKF